MTQLRKVFLLAVFFLSLSCFVQAEDTYYLHIDRKNGAASIDLVLSEKPVLSFSDGSLLVDGSISCKIADINKWYFDKIKPVPTDISAADNVQCISFRDNIFTVSGVTVSELKVFDVQGINQSPLTNCNGSSVILNLNNLPNGVYIIKIGTQSYKVNKK